MPTGTRDLASHVLWERSLERSRRRRVLAEAARKQSIATLDDVAWAVMETSGEISFIKKSE